MSYTHLTSSPPARDNARRVVRADDADRVGPGLDDPIELTPRTPADGLASMLKELTAYWWVELLLGLLWLVIAVVVLKFDRASVTTVGVLTGLMFLVFAAQEAVLAVVDRGRRPIWALFAGLLTVSGVLALIHPVATFAGFADILGFVFLLIGAMWMAQAFAERPFNSLWWLTLIGGVMTLVIAFWLSGQFLVVRAYTLLIFAGVWALTTGTIDIVRAFAIRELGRQLPPRSR